jgi:hypothetical protein
VPPKLPPIARPPRRSLSEIVVRRPVELRAWEDEPPTAPENEPLERYRTILGTCDAMTPDQRLQFVDLAALWLTASAEDRHEVMAFLRARVR